MHTKTCHLFQKDCTKIREAIILESKGERIGQDPTYVSLHLPD